jgi:hypothetical protein
MADYERICLWHIGIGPLFAHTVAEGYDGDGGRDGGGPSASIHGE